MQYASILNPSSNSGWVQPERGPHLPHREEVLVHCGVVAVKVVPDDCFKLQLCGTLHSRIRTHNTTHRRFVMH